MNITGIGSTRLAAVALRPAYWLPGMTAALFVMVWWAAPYSQATIARILALGLLATSVALLTGVAGLPTLGQVAPFAVGAYTTALLARAGVTTGVTQLAVAALAAVVFSVVAGALVVRTRGTVCLMVTLAVEELTVTAASQWKAVTGGTDGLAGIPAVQPVWGMPSAVTDRAVAVYVLAVTAVMIAAVMAVLRSPAGLLLTGCRDNEARMRASGHPVTAYLLAAHTAAGALAGVGGSLYVAAQRYISPADAGFDVAALTLLAVIIGGAASIPTAMAATGLLVLLRDEWTIPGHGPLILGTAFVAAVYLLPDGLHGLWQRITTRLRVRPPLNPASQIPTTAGVSEAGS